MSSKSRKQGKVMLTSLGIDESLYEESVECGHQQTGKQLGVPAPRLRHYPPNTRVARRLRARCRPLTTDLDDLQERR